LVKGAADTVYRPAVFYVPAVPVELGDDQGSWVVVRGQQDRVLQLGAVENHRAGMDQRDEKVAGQVRVRLGDQA
jgi:hypothetical protein